MARIFGQKRAKLKMYKHIHFIGIGGIGMSGIARLFASRGIKISGSDLKKTLITEELKKMGADIFIGHHSGNIKGADIVVYSSAIKEDNPEFQQAYKQKIPRLKRAQALAELMKDKIVITIAGSHGKTTTTSLVAYLLMEAGFLPTVAIGGILKNINNNACPGDGKFFVAEADESDGSFLYYNPSYSIVTNIDREHLDYYKDFNKEIDTFKEFLGKTKKDGCVFCCGDDINLRNILNSYKGKFRYFGLNKDSDIYPANIIMKGVSSEFDCFKNAGFVGRFELSLAGIHNISNALSVIALGLELGINLATIKKALSDYKGAARRIEVKFKNEQYLIIDDYAHHPTEIKATLEAVKNLGHKRIIAVFQPHRYSRTKLLLDEFGKCFTAADYIIITDIYPASESPIKNINGLSLSSKIKEYLPYKQVDFVPKDKLTGHLLDIIRPGDLIITLGAGDIVKINEELIEKINA